MCMQSTQWTIHDLSRTDHSKHTACEYKRLHKYGEKFNASIQIMVKRVTLKTVVLLYITIIQYNTWSVYTQLLLHIVSLRGYVSQSYTWIIIRLVQKQ
jgi:phospholipase/lecithinase/hemolysin